MPIVTLQMIADRCSLSRSTVSYILREPETCIAKASTKKLVLETARAMGYQRNFAARALRTQKYRALGILFPWTYGHYGELVMALDRAMKKHSYHGIYSFWEGEYFDIALQTLCNQGVDAIITAHDDIDLAQCWKPIITYEDCIPGCDCVLCDKKTAVRQLLDYLTEHKYTEIGYIGGMKDRRFSAFIEEMEKRNLPIVSKWFIHTPVADLPTGFHAMKTLLMEQKLPKVVIVHSDLAAQGILNACQGTIDIPKQMGLVSFDNLSWSELTQPPLTTFDRCYDQTAEMLVQTALDRIASPDQPPIVRTAPFRLVERESLITGKVRG